MITITTNASMLGRNTFGIDVKAAVFGEYDTVEGLKMILTNELIEGRKHQIWNIGQGSNILFSGNFDGVILHGKIKGIDIIDETDTEVTVRVGAGEIWDEWHGLWVTASMEQRTFLPSLARLVLQRCRTSEHTVLNSATS